MSRANSTKLLVEVLAGHEKEHKNNPKFVVRKSSQGESSAKCLGCSMNFTAKIS